MAVTMTATEMMRKLYENLDPLLSLSCVPCTDDVRSGLRAWDDLNIPWDRWKNRNSDILHHSYIRGRDRVRAYRQNDFRLARELDDQTLKSRKT